MNPFEYANDLMVKEGYDEDIEQRKDYKEFLINRSMSYQPDLIHIVNEINSILSNIPLKQTNNLINQIISANRIFLVAIGRVNLSLQCFGKRLSHLGFKVELVGALTEKPATKKDLLTSLL